LPILQRINAHASRHFPFKQVRARIDRPIVSISFDDFAKSAWTNGGQILAQYNALATYYVAGIYEGANVDGVRYYDRQDLMDIHAAGHELGCHTFAHKRVPHLSSREIDGDLSRNAAFLRERLGDVVMSSFAYPFGDVSPRTKVLLSRRFASCRGVDAGLNEDKLDLGQLKAVGLRKAAWHAETVDAFIRKAKERCAWLIFFVHDVGADPTPFGITPEMLDFVLTTSKKHQLEILPVKSALARCVFG
jgi:peptidoglycan/xylan/chitin deacetylase (PgdA/CDA1 family)